MKFGSTVLFVDDEAKVLAFYEAAFGLQTKFHDAEFGFAIIDVGGIELGIATHAAGETMMPAHLNYALALALALTRG